MSYTTAYDAMFKAATAKWLPPIVRWEWTKAQGLAESHLEPDIIAYDGGQGVMQIMPATWDEICKDLEWPDDTDVFDPQHNIDAGVYYLAKQWHDWTSPRPYIDHLFLSFAAYNAGFGNVLAAQRLANGATDYESIMERLPEITGGMARVTSDYVTRIHNYYGELTA